MCRFGVIVFGSDPQAGDTFLMECLGLMCGDHSCDIFARIDSSACLEAPRLSLDATDWLTGLFCTPKSQYLPTIPNIFVQRG